MILRDPEHEKQLLRYIIALLAILISGALYALMKT
jgi:hypothetical protein